jgi:hypothetical protein
MSILKFRADRISLSAGGMVERRHRTTSPNELLRLVRALCDLSAGAMASLQAMIARDCGSCWRLLVADHSLRADRPRAFRTGLAVDRAPWSANVRATCHRL